MVMYIALGGAIGAVGRYGVMVAVSSWTAFNAPVGTLSVNVLGSLILGAMIEVSALAWSPSPEIRAMVVIGILGAFTTFSAFSLDSVAMLTRGETGMALIYVAASVILSISAVWVGMAMTKALLT